VITSGFSFTYSANGDGNDACDDAYGNASCHDACGAYGNVACCVDGASRLSSSLIVPSSSLVVPF
jgi:hypothetical protein